MKGRIVEILEKNSINGFSNRGGTDKATDHSYDGLYEEKLEKYLDKDISLMEIGIQYGGSALLWNDLFPKSKLILLDIENKVHTEIWELMDDSRYDFHIMDAYNHENIKELKEKYPDGFDVIIDDGPHTLGSQIFMIQNYLPMIKEGGILIIEDVQSYDHGKILLDSIGGLSHKKSEFVDLRHLKNRYDDLLIVIEK
jgi:predicted O-methyltransferase YrrM